MSTLCKAKENFRNARILVIEDNPDHYHLIKTAMQHCLPEVKPVPAATEAEALAYLKHCAVESWDLPKLILLDLYLPGRENGWRLLDEIRSMPGAFARIPVVLLSYSDRPEDISDAYRRGCSSYLVKPGLFQDWLSYFRSLRSYWWETVTLPQVGYN